MRVTVRLFARLRDAAGTGEIEFEVGDGATVADLWRDLAFRYQGFDRFGRSASPAINGEFVRHDAVLADRDEVALLPPVSGG